MHTYVAKKLIIALSLLLAAASTHGQTPKTATTYPDGSRVVAIGDSITDHGQYHSYAHLYHITRFPDRRVQMLNAGLPGDSARGTLIRYPWDITPKAANAATIMLGMNDVAGAGIYLPGEVSDSVQAQRLQRVDAYDTNLRALVEKLLADGIRPTLITPSIYDETSAMDSANEPGRNWSLAECAKRVKAIAKEYNLPVIDFHGPMSELSAKIQTDNPTATIISTDRIHPRSAGHLVMAYLYLKAMDAPADVARVEINAQTDSVSEALNCTVSDFKSHASGVSFNYLAKALPFPVDPVAEKGLEWVPFTDELNRETLKVTDLPEGNYHLSIDGENVREYTATELASGVNLALENTPQARQARQVLQLYNEEYRSPVSKLRSIAFIEHALARTLPRPLSVEQIQPKLEPWVDKAKGLPHENFFRTVAEEYLVNKPQEDALAEQAEQALPKIRAAAQPQQHSISLTRVN